eukprot:CAMPEP_0196570512 /NCGR_PEP_ID=MMETSP1081-20130531/634_1 /TAXON_ID=36882 /ORGANISM="Pyramimonas amylifera, Strain CCMP720" /LENGTH=168 /DNA_ID=CAMNT_0041887003 /DNA_START=123 /DNA_END=629 /DNA_ORIENTATION=-
MTIGGVSGITTKTADSQRREFAKRVRIGDARLDRRTGLGNASKSKKNGAGGKGTWGTWEDDCINYYEECASTVQRAPMATISVELPATSEYKEFDLAKAFPVESSSLSKEFNEELKRMIQLLTPVCAGMMMQKKPQKLPQKLCRENFRHPRSFQREGVRFSQPRGYCH